MKIGFATNDWSPDLKSPEGHPAWGGSAWARFGQYITPLRADYTVTYGRLIGAKGRLGVRDWDGTDHLDLDVVIMHRWMLESLLPLVEAAKANGQYIINDVDDWYWGMSTSNHAWRTAFAFPDENINHYKHIICASSLITTSTPYLASRMLAWSKTPIHIVENHVDFSRFKQVIQSDEPTIGWVGATSVRSNDLERMRGVLCQLEDEFKFHHSGAIPGREHEFAEAVGVKSATTSLMVSPHLYSTLFSFDVGIVPLSDIPFNHAKSFIKGLEYAASGVPFVASPVGEYIRLNKQFGVGHVGTNPRNFVKLLRMMHDRKVREEIAAMNLIGARRFDISNGVSIWKDIIDAASV